MIQGNKYGGRDYIRVHKNMSSAQDLVTNLTEENILRMVFEPYGLEIDVSLEGPNMYFITIDGYDVMRMGLENLKDLLHKLNQGELRSYRYEQ